ncbi:MAG: beta-ketoacyl-[acyl-carrier-protein] synthase family protein [Fuerstiella sp.]|nr:beta-ketoacyl-[acyl-carrier-protein] synthase family protein [Fuerstiella sp.]MCP4853247.1 beta-ketoacyl-[acyl-carrier-protein] synthase family protein [Fuerstiella sp.]
MNDLRGEQTRIVITGLGAVCSAGRTADQLWTTLTRRKSGNNHTTTEVSEPGRKGTPGVADFSGSIKDFGDLPDAKRKFIRKSLKLMNRETQMGVAAGQQALSDSGALEPYDPDRFGVCFGADNVSIMPSDFQRGIQACTSTDGNFEMERWGVDGLDEIAPLWILKCLPNMPACHLAIANDLRGPSNTITQRDVSANLAIAEACRSIRAGDADAVLVGGTGTTLTPFNYMHARMEDEVHENDAICRPFDRRRGGSASGEGAGAVVLEGMHSALRRNAHIYGEILGAASASFVGTAGQANCRRALTVALSQVLDRAGRTPSEIGHIHAHGLGTWASDVAEAQAIRDVWGQESAQTPVVAAKSHLANSAAGAGALELIASVLAMESGHLFPILNYETPDPSCPIHPVVDYDTPAGGSFLNLNMFGRGLASCVAVGAYAA